MTYQEALGYIHGALRFGMKPGLERTAALLKKLGNPQKKLKAVHVAGTNGKGSVCSATASALAAAGYKTGLYLSPYIVDFRERIQINGKMIPEEEMAGETERVKNAADSLAGQEPPTEFELVTAVAFDYFARQECDYVVLEVGLGGRFDATNVIEKPLVSVVTTISYDHTAILGDTLTKIAFEKCGIIKPGGITVSSAGQEPEAMRQIETICKQRQNRLVVPELSAVEILGESIEGLQIRYRGKDLFIPLAGRHQIVNFTAAYEVLTQLSEKYGMLIDDDKIKDGFASVKFPARMEILHKNPLVILDGAHNPSGISTLKDSILRYLGGRKKTVVMGMLKDKDYRTAIAQIASLADRFLAVRPESGRALPAAQTAEVASAFCRNVKSFDDYGQALRAAVEGLDERDAVIICGSLYLAGEMKKAAVELFRHDSTK